MPHSPDKIAAAIRPWFLDHVSDGNPAHDEEQPIFVSDFSEMTPGYPAEEGIGIGLYWDAAGVAHWYADWDYSFRPAKRLPAPAPSLSRPLLLVMLLASREGPDFVAINVDDESQAELMMITNGTCSAEKPELISVETGRRMVRGFV